MRFRQGRKDSLQGEAEFINMAAPDASKVERDVIILVRQVIAESCGMTTDELRADDLPSLVEQLVGIASAKEFWHAMMSLPVESIDSLEFFDELEWHLEKYFGDFTLDIQFQRAASVRWRESESVGAWVSWIAREVKKRSVKKRG